MRALQTLRALRANPRRYALAGSRYALVELPHRFPHDRLLLILSSKCLVWADVQPFFMVWVPFLEGVGCATYNNGPLACFGWGNSSGFFFSEY